MATNNSKQKLHPVIPKELDDKLEEISKETGFSKNIIVRLALQDYVKKYMKNNK